MRKKIKNLTRKVLTILIAFGMVFQMFAPTLVFAVVNVNANRIELGGEPEIDGNTFNYDNGSVTISLNGVAQNAPCFSVALGDKIRLEFSPIENYEASLSLGDGSPVTISNNVYEFVIGKVESKLITLIPSFTFHDPEMETLKFDFTINGESFTNVSIGDELLIPANFNMNELEELYITKIVTGDSKTYTYDSEEYSYDLLDNQGRHILETSFVKMSDNYVNLRFICHGKDILASDLERFDKTVADYFELYNTGVKLVKSGFRGVSIDTGDMPDNYDFTVWNGADLGETTLSNPGKVSAYYGAEVINLNSKESNPIKTIELVEDNGVPSSAVEINNADGTVKVLSNYYNQILIKVTLEDDTVGYIQINRIGIFIGDLNQNLDTFYHGAANGAVAGNLDVQTDKQRLVAVFYHNNETDYEDYDLIVNILYKDGTTETKLATGVGSVPNLEGDITGSDYILWAGDSIGNSIDRVSVTAVEKGAISNETTFGGATFGSGSGVVWEPSRRQ